MSLRIRFRFDGRCSVHPRYNPERDGRPQHKDCLGCESIRVIQLYVSIARRRAESGEGMIVSRPEGSTVSDPADGAAQSLAPDVERQDTEGEDLDTTASH